MAKGGCFGVRRWQQRVGFAIRRPGRPGPQPRVDVVGASMDGRAFRRTGLKGGMQFSRGGLGPILPACWKGAD